jgi:outer membrane protein assembly factor BamB
VPNTWPGYPDTNLDLAAVRARLVLVSILEGSANQAREELVQFARLHPHARGQLGGREVDYGAALAELLKQSRRWPKPVVGPDWPMLAGSPQRNKIVPQMVDPAGVAWRVPLPRYVPPTVGGNELRPGVVAEDPASPLSYHPILVGDRVFVCDHREIDALDVATGKPAWGDAAAAMYREQWEGAAAGLVNPADTLGIARFTLSASDSRLFAKMGSAVTTPPQQSIVPITPGSLLCLDLSAEGKLLWKATPEEGWAFEGAPIARGADVFVAMRRSDIRPQAHVACFDVSTGKLRWRRLVCSAETPARGTFAQSTQGLLTLDGGTIYYNTNLGAVAALAADDGRIQWVSLYPRARRGDLLHLAPHWQRDLNPCLLDRGTLLVAPADSPRLFAFDAATGQILWQTGTEVEDIVHLLGVVDDQLIASGGRLYWIATSGPNRGQIRHLWPEGQEKPGYGRGVLASNRVLWPTRQKIYVFDQRTAEPKKVIDLVPWGVTGGNLLVAGPRLLIATGTELIALGQPEGGRPKAEGGSEPLAVSQGVSRGIAKPQAAGP